jgi:cytoplasmic iron level regulating protein YaaA (DUF328/UPF0246 family)
MIILLSPAKTLDCGDAHATEAASQPAFLADAERLVQKLKKLTPKKLQSLMSINPELAQLNADRFQAFETPFHPGNANPAVACFQGEVYRGLDAKTLTTPDLEYAQRHLRILSGLYGILRPLDLMQPYRLEMGTKWGPTPTKNTLYKFWGTKISDAIAQEADGCIINLASKEYGKAAMLSETGCRVIEVHFKDWHNGELKALMTYAKHARGAMARHLIRNRAAGPDAMFTFDGMGYRFSESHSTENEWTFTRNTAKLETK